MLDERPALGLGPMASLKKLKYWNLTIIIRPVEAQP